jgi:hypothetical protein
MPDLRSRGLAKMPHLALWQPESNTVSCFTEIPPFLRQSRFALWHLHFALWQLHFVYRFAIFIWQFFLACVILLSSTVEALE